MILDTRKMSLVAGVLMCSSLLPGYTRQLTNALADPSPAFLFRTDSGAMQVLLNKGVTAGAQSSASGKLVTVISSGSDPVAATRAALTTWNSVGTANLKFLPLKPTDLDIDSSDGSLVVSIGKSADDLSALGGALALTVNFHVNGDGVLNGVNVKKGVILDSDIILNPAISFSTDGTTSINGTAVYDLQSVMTHELGHLLTANHSGLLGAMMFQAPVGRVLSADDLAFAAAAYPLPNGGAASGTISGRVTAAGAGVPYALLTAFDTAAGVTVGGITSLDGSYSFQVPAGNYQIYAEPLNGAVPINIYLSQPDANLAAATKFQTTFYNGSLSVTGGGTATADIGVTGGAATLATPVVAVSQLNASPAAGYRGGPVTVPSGQSVDLILAGTGFDATLSDGNFKIYGKGITLHAGSIRVDTHNSFNGFNDLRVTLDVAAQTAPQLATFIVTTPAGTVSFSGALVVVPPTPATTSQSIISAASFLGNGAGDGAVSPGGLYALYPAKNASIGPVTGLSNPPSFDAYGNLPTVLGGVSVTFDGVPAPLFYVSAGQINLQVPFEVAGKKTTRMIIDYLGSASPAVTVPVIAAQPSLYTANYSGTGPVIAFHFKDGTLNTAQNPAAEGDLVLLYGTGVGKVSYSILTGQAAPTPPSNFTGNYTYSIGGSAAASALFGGWAPTFAGFAQWNLQIPANSSTGAVPITVTDTATGASSQPGATIFVK